MGNFRTNYFVTFFGLLLLTGFTLPCRAVAETFAPTWNFEVSQISFVYGGPPGKNLPPLIELADIELEIAGEIKTVSELLAGVLTPFELSLRELQEISQLPLQYLKSFGYEGLVAFPDPNQIDPITGEDLRQPGQTGLRIVVWVSRVESVEFLNGGINPQVFEKLDQLGRNSFLAQEERGKPLTTAHLRYWKRFGKSRSRTATTTLMAGEEPGGVRPSVKLGLGKKQGGKIHASNTGTETTGYWILGGTFFYNQLSGRDDDLEFSAITSDTFERQAFNLKYSLPLLYPDVLNVDFQGGYSSYDASSFAITQIDFEGETRFFDFSLQWDPLAWEYENFALGMKLGMRREQVEAENSLISGRANADFLIPRMALVMQTKGSYLRTFTELEIRRNLISVPEHDRALLGGVSAVDKATRLKIAHLQSFKIGKWLQNQWNDNLPAQWNHHLLLAKFSGDWGLQKNRHLPQHQFIAGGTGSVRGYPESLIAGDYGYSASFDYRMPFFSGDTGTGLGGASSELIAFFDWAETFVNQPFSYESDHSIAGAGIGWEIKFSNGLQARLDLAKPLREINNNGTVLDGTRSSDRRVHSRITWDF